LTAEGLTDARFTRLKWLRHLLETGQLDGNLRWRDAVEEKPYAAAGGRR
jgi:hypothetical protein